MVKMMSILKKVKLSLLASVIILSSQRASALGSDPDDLEGNKIPISQPSSSRDCSKSAADLETQGETRIPKKELEDISGFFSPAGARLIEFENPPKNNITVIKHRKPKEKRKKIKISSPPPASMKVTTLQDFERDLPVIFDGFFKRIEVLCRKVLPQDTSEAFEEFLCSFRKVERLYQTFNQDYPIRDFPPRDYQDSIPIEMQRLHYIKRQASRTLMKNQLDDEKKLTSDPQGDSPRLSRNPERSSIRFALESSPLFQKMGAGEELQSSSYNSSPVSPRFTEESSSSSQLVGSPPSSPPFLQRRKTINGGPLARPMNGSSLPSIHYVPTEESSSLFTLVPLRTTEGSLSSQPLPTPTLFSPPPPPHRQTIIGSTSSLRPLPKVPTVRTIPSIDSPAMTQETPSPSLLSQVSPLPEGLHRSRSLSASPSPSPLVRRTPLSPPDSRRTPLSPPDSRRTPLSPPDSRRRAMYYTNPLILPEIETDSSEVISDKSGVPSQSSAETPER